VLDPFCGVGSIPVACARHQRRYVGIEIDPEYMRVAGKRIRELGAGGRS
jgi:site-specific DNA-methyltransferase (adenine-specific)